MNKILILKTNSTLFFKTFISKKQLQLSSVRVRNRAQMEEKVQRLLWEVFVKFSHLVHRSQYCKYLKISGSLTLAPKGVHGINAGQKYRYMKH